MSVRSLLMGVVGICCAMQAWGDAVYSQVNLVSNIPGLAANTDPNLVNPWGVSESPAGPFWVSDNGPGLSTLYNGAGQAQSLVVSIPGPGGATSAPTGQVFNSTVQFNGDSFLFATENGTIAGWRGALGTTAETLYDNSANGAVYKGVALVTNAQGSYVLAANFHSNNVDVFPSSGASALAGKFIDPALPAGYAPFNVQDINGQVFVTYAKQGSGTDEIDGAGNGFVSVFDTNGNFVKRIASNGTLNAPWGLAVAPANWGSFGGDLLVGNFGNGEIGAYTASGSFAGLLNGADGTPLTDDGLWALTFGNGGAGGSANSLYVTAGLNGEADGLFARVDPVVPEPGTYTLLGLGLPILWMWRSRRKA